MVLIKINFKSMEAARRELVPRHGTKEMLKYLVEDKKIFIAVSNGKDILVRRSRPLPR